MNHKESPAAVVVGIDGSQSAIRAAEWGVDEAVCRDIPLRLVHVIQSTSKDVHLEIEDGEAALQAAHAAVEATGKQVKVESTIVRGQIAATLVAESRDAAMVCVGSVGIGYFARKLLGSNAAAVAQSAHCPVAIIRTHDDAPRSESDYIAVVVDESSDNDAVLHMAMEEARLRTAPLVALGVWPFRLGEKPYDQVDRRLADWQRRYPDVHAHTVAVRVGIAEFLAEGDPTVQLAIVGDGEGDEVTRLVGPFGRFVLYDTDCSVLVVRQ